MTHRLFLLISVFIVLACGQHEDTIGLDPPRKRVRSPHQSDPSVTSHERFGFEHTDSFFQPHKSAPAVKGNLAWKIPNGWELSAPTSMRNPNFRIKNAPEIECYVTRLDGGGGGLEANISRWYSQMGLPAPKTGELTAAEMIETPAGNASFVNIAGTFSGMSGPSRSSYRLMGALIFNSNISLTVKMVGPDTSVLKQEGAFRQFVESLRPGGETNERATNNVRPAAFHNDLGPDKDAFEWTVPDHWKNQGAQGIRLVSFTSGEDENVTVGMFKMLGNAGGLEANINRWYLQMDLSPLDSKTIGELDKIDVLNQKSTLVHIRGTFSDNMRNIHNQDNYALLGLVCPLEKHTLFIKMTGPAEEVDLERKHFLRFCESLAFKSAQAD